MAIATWFKIVPYPINAIRRRQDRAVSVLIFELELGQQALLYRHISASSFHNTLQIPCPEHDTLGCRHCKRRDGLG